MPVPQQRAAVERHLLRDTAYTTLCEAIVSGTLTPGEQLHDQELCAWLGLSRTPVRDALTRLEDEGLVETAPQRYTRVTPLRPADAQSTFPLLAVVHALATELAVPALTARDVADLTRANDTFKTALHAGDRPVAFGADERLHDIFVARAGNPQLRRTLERLTPGMQRLRNLVAMPLPGGRSVAQHHAIIERAAAGDAAGAASATRANWLTLGMLIERSLAGRRPQEPMPAAVSAPAAVSNTRP